MKKQLLIIIAAVGIFSSAHAVVFYEEGYNLTDGTQLNGNLGYTGGGSNVTVSDYTWSSWTNYSTIANKAVGTDASQNTRANAGFTSTVDADTAGTMYFSFTMNGDTAASSGWLNFMISEGDPASFNSTSGDDVFVQWDGGGKSFDNSGDPLSDNLTGLAAAGGQDLLVIGRVDFETAASIDTYSLSVFTAGQDASAVFSGFQEVANERNTTGDLDTLALRITGDTIFGNVRVGSTLGDVAVVPEPSTYALLLIAGGMLLGLRRFQKRTN